MARLKERHDLAKRKAASPMKMQLGKKEKKKLD